MGSRREDMMRWQVLHAALLYFITILLVFCSSNLALLHSYMFLPFLDVTPSQIRSGRPESHPLAVVLSVQLQTQAEAT